MAAKGKRKKRGKSPKKVVDWGAEPRERYVYLEVRNSAWISMRFTQMLPTAAPLDDVRRLICERHQVVAALGLRLFLGRECAPQFEFKSEDYGATLEELKICGGSKNDMITQVAPSSMSPQRSMSLPPIVSPRHHASQVITYEHAPFSKSIMNVPRGLPVPLTQIMQN